MNRIHSFRSLILKTMAVSAVCGILSCSKSESPVDAESISSATGKNAAKTLAIGEVTRSSTTWTAKVDGSTKYTGSNMMDAIQAAINAMASGTVHVRASGDSGPSGGVVKSINLKSNVFLDFHGFTFNCNSGDAFIIPVKARNSTNIGVTNLVITGNPRYGILFQSCNGMNISNIVQNTTASGGLGIRVDHGGTAGVPRNLTISGNINIQTRNQCIETYGLDGFTIGNVTVGNSADGCGLLLNQSKNGTVGTVTATNCNYNGSYAGFRVANTNGPNVKVVRVNATGCARGVTSTSNSNGLTIDYVDARNNRQMGVNIYSSQYVWIKGGYIWNNGGGGVEITTDGNQSHHNTIENVSTNDGLHEWGGCDYNTFRNCRLNGSPLTISGANSSAPGTY